MAGGMVTMQTGDDGISDEEIVARAEHDPRHFAPLYRRYAKPIHAFVLRRTGDPEQAADITSQVFTRALAALPRYRTGPFRGWIYAIARNVVIDSRRRARPIVPIAAAELIASRDVAPDDQVIANEARATLMAALETLSETQRQIVMLRLAGLTGREVAEELGMGYAAMKSAQYRAFTRLRRHLDPDAAIVIPRLKPLSPSHPSHKEPGHDAY